jgi:uncharacterized membrane protein YagU involved in acid resistance
MKKQPTSITVIAWILIVIGVISLITTTIGLNNPMVKEVMSRSSIPIPAQYIMNYVGLLITLISGIAMLKGKNWARLLYVIYSIISIVIGFATSPMKAALVSGCIIFLVVVFFLFRPKAKNYFTGSGA